MLAIIFTLFSSLMMVDVAAQSYSKKSNLLDKKMSKSSANEYIDVIVSPRLDR